MNTDFPIKINLLINGEELESNDYLDVTDPGAFDTVVGTVAQATIAQMNDAVETSHTAFSAVA